MKTRRLIVFFAVVFCAAFTGCTTTAPPDYFDGWRSQHVNKYRNAESFTRSEPFDLREGATVE